MTRDALQQSGATYSPCSMNPVSHGGDTVIHGFSMSLPLGNEGSTFPST